MKRFLALDFETANRINRHSVCSVGIAVVENGKIIDQIYSLINPEESFDPLNIDIHGITERDVVHAPTFPEFYESIRNLLEGANVMAHNLSFDGYVLRDVLQKYNVPSATHHLLCTLQMAKTLWKGYKSYSLNNLCYQKGIILPKHHHAMNDAVACAELFLLMQEEYSLYSLQQIESVTGFAPGQITSSTYRSFVKSKPLRTAFDKPFEKPTPKSMSDEQMQTLLGSVMNHKKVMAPQNDFTRFITRGEYEELGRTWGLFGVNPKDLFVYKGHGMEENVQVIGYQSYGKHATNYTIIIQFEDGSLGCVHPAYLKEMQTKGFKHTIISD